MNISLSLFLPGASGQRVKVEPEVSSYPGQTVNLRCAFTDATGIQLTMVRYTHTHTHCCDTIVFIVFGQDLITTGYHRTHIKSKPGLWCEVLIKMSVSSWNCSSLC